MKKWFSFVKPNKKEDKNKLNDMGIGRSIPIKQVNNRLFILVSNLKLN